MENQSPDSPVRAEKKSTTIPKRVSFPDNETDVVPRPRPSALSKSKSFIPNLPESPLTKPFKPLFACFRTRYLSFKQPESGKKEFHHRKRASNFSLMSTLPTFQQMQEDAAMDDEGMYVENTQNKVEIKANLVSKTKLRTLNALAGILKNRKSVPTDTLAKMRGRKKMHAYEDVPVAQAAQVHADSYDTVVKILKAAQPNCSGSKKRHIKVMVDLPKLPFGKHVAYNSVTDFKASHVVDFEPSAQLMDKVTNEIWVRKLERRKTLGVDTEIEKKPELDVNFQTEELQLYNSKLKVAEENLYMHYSTGSKFWRRDMMEKQAGWRGLYRLEVKRMSNLNVTSTF